MQRLTLRSRKLTALLPDEQLWLHRSICREWFSVLADCTLGVSHSLFGMRLPKEEKGSETKPTWPWTARPLQSCRTLRLKERDLAQHLHQVRLGPGKGRDQPLLYSALSRSTEELVCDYSTLF